jgi:hypothetical protein
MEDNLKRKIECTFEVLAVVVMKCSDFLGNKKLISGCAYSLILKMETACLSEM